MLKILLIDGDNSSVHGFQHSLENKGFALIKVRSLKEASSFLMDKVIDLLVINSSVSSDPVSLAKFIKLSHNCPKIVIAPDPKGISGPWVRDRLVIPVHEPIAWREFYFLVNKALADRKITEENQRLHALLKSKEKELTFFEDITKMLTSTLEFSKVLTAIMKKTMHMVGAEMWFFLFYDQEKNELSFGKTSRPQTEEVRKFRIKADKDIAGWVVRNGIHAVVPDVSADKRCSGEINKFLGIKAGSLICLPVKIKDKVVGIIEVINKTDKGAFSEEDLDVLLQVVTAIERVFLHQKMEDLTIRDDLTSLFNMRYLTSSIETEIERCNRYGPPLSLIFMDIDFFKKVNDQHGHLVGSKVLVELAQLLLNNLRTLDIVARYGGDEFVAVLPQTSLKTGFVVAERLRKTVEQHLFLKNDGYSIKITASFGVAAYPESAKNKEELFRIADEAMYRGKFSTKNIVFAAAK